MAESMIDVRELPKAEAYAALEGHLRQAIEGIRDPIAVMSTMSCLLYHGFGHLWVGFYRVVSPGLLRVGPYQGTLGCMEIEFGRGVCGTAAVDRKTVVVPDVLAFPGHIACDARARSEIVVPVTDAEGTLIAVLDIDAEAPSTFDDRDALGLERMVRLFAETGAGVPPALPDR
jgi:L-methionine (R)-S-oxide reductase